MACGCSGSTVRHDPSMRTNVEVTRTDVGMPGGPGDPGYYWSGPQRPQPVAQQPAQPRK
jgi:hypothetical protein